MTTRRSFLKQAGGMVFCSCCLPGVARAQAGDARLPVMVAGKRVKTIDVHAHCLFQEALALMGEGQRRTNAPVKGRDEMNIVVEQRLKEMDGQAIDMEVLSINPFWYGTDRDTAGKIVDLQNQKLGELCAAHPDRFAAYASLALQHPDLAWRSSRPR